jgi:hypothetical protein
MTAAVQAQHRADAQDEVFGRTQVGFDAVLPQTEIEVTAMEIAVIFCTSGVEIFDGALVAINAPGFAIHWPRIVSREVPQFQTVPNVLV